MLSMILSFVLYQIEDLDTLCEVREDDLREAGLKTGDIITGTDHERMRTPFILLP